MRLNFLGTMEDGSVAPDKSVAHGVYQIDLKGYHFSFRCLVRESLFQVFQLLFRWKAWVLVTFGDWK